MTDFGAPPGSFPPPPVPPSPPPPLFGERSGPPWEQPGPFVQRFIDTAKGALLDPTATFRNMRREGGLGNPLVYYLVGGLISVLFQAMWSGLGLSPGSSYGYGASAGVLGALMFGACVVVIAIFIGSGIIHLMLMLLGGQRFPFETTFRTLAYAHGSSAPIGAIPFCGGVIAAIWGLVVAIIGLSQTQEISIGKAAAAVLIPGIVCCVLAMLAFGAAIMAALGVAAMGSR